MAGRGVRVGLGMTETEVVRQNIKELEHKLAVKKEMLKKLETQIAAEPAVEVVRDWRFELVRSVGEECQREEELANLLSKKQTGFRFYDGFEPSGRMHIAQGVLKTINVNKCTKAGGTFVFWVADWFALMNDKMGGNLERIKTVGQYFVEVWKAAGMNLENVEFKWSSEEINKHAEDYWTQMLDVARQFTLTRVMKCCTIMGRNEGNLTCAQVLYPLMQCTDIFHLKADICQLGVDQRKVNMLAREYCDSIGKKLKPIILSHHMMAGLLKDQAKMSKSVEGSAVFMEDSAEDVAQKINNAWCPIGERMDENPILDVADSLVFTAKLGPLQTAAGAFATRKEVEAALLDKSLKEADLRAAIITVINAKLEPVRRHFIENDHAKAILAKVKEYKAAVVAEEAAKKAAPPEPPAAASYDKDQVLIPILPTNQATLNQAWTTALHAKRLASSGKKVTVLLMDWTGFLLNVCAGDKKSIKAVLTLTMKWIEALMGKVDGVTMVWQSEAILRDASTYWVGVINCGRKLQLAECLKAMGKEGELKESDTANEVIASIMLHQDVATSGCGVVVAPNKPLKGVLQLLGCEVVDLTHTVPCLKEGMICAEATLNGQYAELVAPQMIYLHEGVDMAGSKIKKAYCAPEVAAANPIIQVAAGLMLNNPTFEVSRKKQGDTLAFTSSEELRKAYDAGDIHPGDLKQTVSDAIKKILTDTRTALAKDATFAPLETQIANFNKKLAKGSKPAKKK